MPEKRARESIQSRRALPTIFAKRELVHPKLTKSARPLETIYTSSVVVIGGKEAQDPANQINATPLFNARPGPAERVVVPASSLDFVTAKSTATLTERNADGEGEGGDDSTLYWGFD